MVDLVRTADTCQITVVAFKCSETVMNKPIVEGEVDNAVGTYSGAYPKAIVKIDMPYPHQPQGQCSKANTEQVVQLKPAMALLVVRFMNKSQRPVKQVFMHCPRH
jgi:hypothetical protein